MASPRVPRRKSARNWSKAKRISEAVHLVVDEGWTRQAAADEMGVARQTVSVHVKEHLEKAKAEAEREKARKAEAFGAQNPLGLSPLGINEKRRVPEDFATFDEVYFGHLKCPDCGVRHKVPDFHVEIADACESSDPRVLINLPPYHSKSTNVTVKDTLRKICANPNHRTIIVSKSLSFTRTFVRALQELMSNTDLYEGAQRSLIEDWGPFRSEDGKGWSADQLYVAGRVTAEKDPTVQALGVGGQIYGRRADEIKFDDIATIENQRNPERVVEMLEWIDKEALSRIGKNGRAIWVGTRVSPGDIYYHLGQRPGYRVLRYPCIVDDTNELTLWPEHFPYSQAAVHRSEMTPSSFQLVYQQVDIPGLGASFTEEIVDGAKDKSRVTGHYESSWRLVAGLDPAGAGKEAGFTAFTLVGVDLATSKRYLIDQVAVKQMKAPQIRDQILDWSSRYPIYEWRVEGNGLQSQLVQYNEEIINALARRGVRVVGHTTNQNKWDPQFGVESMAPLMEMGMYSIPWASAPTAKQWQPFIEELIAFPMGRTADRVMSWWFAELGIRQYLQRSHLPLFDARHTKRWPNRIKRRRHVVDFNSREVRRVSPADQMVGHVSRVQLEQRRATVGRPLKHADAARVADERPRQGLVNVAGEVILEG